MGVTRNFGSHPGCSTLSKLLNNDPCGTIWKKFGGKGSYCSILSGRELAAKVDL